MQTQLFFGWDQSNKCRGSVSANRNGSITGKGSGSVSSSCSKASFLCLALQVWIISETGSRIRRCVKYCKSNDDCEKEEQCSRNNTCAPRLCPKEIVRGQLSPSNSSDLSIEAKASLKCNPGYVIRMQNQPLSKKSVNLVCSQNEVTLESFWSILSNGQMVTECEEGSTTA